MPKRVSVEIRQGGLKVRHLIIKHMFKNTEHQKQVLLRQVKSDTVLEMVEGMAMVGLTSLGIIYRDKGKAVSGMIHGSTNVGDLRLHLQGRLTGESCKIE